MDSKKTIMGYIKPNLVPVIILIVIPFLTIIGLLVLLFAALPTMKRAKKNVEKLEARGELDRAAAELMSADSKRLMKGNLVLTEHYVFCKHNGLIFTYDEIQWAYKHRQTTTFLLIPISVTESLYLAAKGMKPRIVASMGKDKLEEIKTAIIEIYQHNNACLIGYSDENRAKYKQVAVR